MTRRSTRNRYSTLLLVSILSACLATPGAAFDSSAAQDAVPALPQTEDFVLAHVAVKTSDGRYVLGLGQQDFEVREGGAMKPATLLGYDLPASVVFVVDVSGSMFPSREKDWGQFVEELKKGVVAFAQMRRTPTEYALVTFALSPRVHRGFTPDPDSIVDGLEWIETTEHRTAFYDAAVLGIQTALEGAHARKVVVLVSDGIDNRSKGARRKDLERLAEESNVMVLLICMNRHARRPERYGVYTINPLCETFDDLDEKTGGGRLVIASQSEFEVGFQWAAQRLENQYTLRFDRTKAEKSKFIKIEVRMSDEARRNPVLKGHKVVGPRGYRTSGQTK